MRFRRMFLTTACQTAALLAALSWTRPVDAAKIACVGDSITYGYGLDNASTESYPAVLQTLVGAVHTVQNFGVSGATLLKSGDKPYWNEAAFTSSDGFGPDVVVIMLGTNDAKPQNWSHKAEFPGDYQGLIDHYRELGALVYVVAPPPVYDPGAFDIPPDVVDDEVVPLVRQIATEANAPLIDVFQALSGKASNFPDTVHPDAAGARLIAQTVDAALEEHGLGGAAATGGAGGTATGGAGGTATGGGAGGDSGGAATAGGGAVITGGTEPEGGAPATGGVHSGGARTAAGGTTATGGANVSGGVPATGGASALGGRAATGGSDAVGGGAATGGTAGSGGSAPVAPTGGHASGGASSGGGSGTATGGNAAAGGGADGTTVTTQEDGCGCHVDGRGSWPSSAYVAGLMMSSLLLGRRRRPI
jgi:acyl-CoA thioesterase-1